MKTLLASWSRCGRTVCKLHSRVSWSSWSSKSLSWSSRSEIIIMFIKVIVLVIMVNDMVIVIVTVSDIVVIIRRGRQNHCPHYALFLSKVKVKFLVATDIYKQPWRAKEESFQSSQGPATSWHSTWMGATMKYNEWFP